MCDAGDTAGAVSWQTVGAPALCVARAFRGATVGAGKPNDHIPKCSRHPCGQLLACTWPSVIVRHSERDSHTYLASRHTCGIHVSYTQLVYHRRMPGNRQLIECPECWSRTTPLGNLGTISGGRCPGCSMGFQLHQLRTLLVVVGRVGMACRTGVAIEGPGEEHPPDAARR